MTDIEAERIAQGISDASWREDTRFCHALRVARVVPETHDAMSIVLDVPPALAEPFAYRAGQFLSFKIPLAGRVLVRSYSLSSSPETDREHKVTVKRVDDGRVSNWMNDRVRAGSTLMVVPPAGLFVLDPRTERDLVLWSGGSGITPCISILKTALATTRRRALLVYANRDARSIIFRDEIEALCARHPDRLRIVHSLDDQRGFVSRADVEREMAGSLDRDCYLCGPAAFMDTVESALRGLGVARERIHIERFLSPVDHTGEAAPASAPADPAESAPGSIAIALDGRTHEVPYTAGERVLEAARRAGLHPPFSCEEGYCSCCMARLVSGRVQMAANDCLTPEMLAEGWVLTCQARCVSGPVQIEYPD
jgi:3-ketosteroid 9alpha-monooxygenase subunit B